MNNNLVVRNPAAEAQQGLEQHWSYLQAMRDAAVRFVVHSPADEQQAAQAMSQVKQLQKNLEERRSEYTKPLYAVVREVEGKFRPCMKEIEAIYALLEGKLLLYRQTKEAARLRAIEAAAATALAMRTGYTENSVRQYQALVAEGSEGPESKVGGVYFRTKTRARVVSAEQVPPAVLVQGQPTLLWRVDDEALDRIAQLPPEQRPNIPGVVWEAFEEVAQVRR